MTPNEISDVFKTLPAEEMRDFIDNRLRAKEIMMKIVGYMPPGSPAAPKQKPPENPYQQVLDGIVIAPQEVVEDAMKDLEDREARGVSIPAHHLAKLIMWRADRIDQALAEIEKERALSIASEGTT